MKTLDDRIADGHASSLPGMRLHHVGYAVSSIQDIAAAYVTRFGYTVSTPVIHDPIQTAFVQFLKLPGDQAYLEFVAPDGPESVLTGAMKRHARLNHLCYAVGSLNREIEHLEQQGLRLLSAAQPAVAFGGRPICWLIGDDLLPIELVETMSMADACAPGLDGSIPLPHHPK